MTGSELKRAWAAMPPDAQVIDPLGNRSGLSAGEVCDLIPEGDDRFWSLAAGGSVEVSTPWVRADGFVQA